MKNSRREKATFLAKFLRKRYRKDLARPWYESPFKVLVATILSQRTREENTTVACEQLFSVAKTPKEVARLSLAKLERLIRPAGLSRAKARNIKSVSQILLERYRGKVPRIRSDLLALPGVGLKTADVVLSLCYQKPTIPVDVHVTVTAKRLGLVSKKAGYEEIRKTLETLIPDRYKSVINRGLVLFGREFCLTTKPRCSLCPLTVICQYAKKKARKKGGKRKKR